MPSILMPLESSEELINQPIYVQINKLIDDNINYINSSGNALTAKEGINLSNKDESTIRITEESMDEVLRSNNITGGSNNPNLINDDEIGLSLKVTDVDKRLTINVSRRFSTKGEAVWWSNRLFARIREGVQNVSREVNITPCVSSKVITLVDTCRKLKIARGMPNEEFMNYLTRISDKGIRLETNSDKSTVALTFPTKIGGIILSLPVEEPKPILEDGKYIVEFSIITTIRVPTGFLLRYPNSVGGKWLPREMIDTSIDVNNAEEGRVGGFSNWTKNFTGDVIGDYRTYCYQLPKFENHVSPVALWNVSPVFQVRINATKSDRRYILNINDLFSGTGPFTLDPNMMHYMESNKDICMDVTMSAVSIVITRADVMIPYTNLTIDDKMILRSDVDLDLFGNYHVLITVPKQPAAMPTHMLETMREHPKLMASMLKHTNPNLNIDALPDTGLVTKTTHGAIMDDIMDLPQPSVITANALVNVKL